MLLREEENIETIVSSTNDKIATGRMFSLLFHLQGTCGDAIECQLIQQPTQVHEEGGGRREEELQVVSNNRGNQEVINVYYL